MLGYGGYLLGVQMLAFLVILLWAGFLTFILFGILSLLNRLRLPTGHPLATEFVRRAVPPAAPLAAAKQKRAGNGADGDESDPYEYSYQVRCINDDDYYYDDDDDCLLLCFTHVVRVH